MEQRKEHAGFVPAIDKRATRRTSTFLRFFGMPGRNGKGPQVTGNWAA